MEAKKELAAALCELMPEMQAQITEILQRYTVSRESEAGRCNLKKRIEHFLTAKRIDGLSDKTLREYGYTLRMFSERVNKHVAKITTDDIRDYIEYLAHERGLKESSMQTKINTLRSFFRWLDEEDLIKKNPMRKIKSSKIDRTKTRNPLTQEELEQLREGCKSYREKALVEFLVSTGCRLSEVCGIQISQVNWLDRSIAVTGKGNKTRTIYFSVRAKRMLKHYIKQRRGGGTALFASSRAPYEALKPRAIEKIVQKIGVQAQEERGIYPHLMRHTFASRAYDSGMELGVLQKILGHEDPKTTLIYAKVSNKKIQYEYEKIIA